MIKVLFVCTGNICRSPTAEGVLRRLAKDAGLDAKIAVDSAGTHGYHVGDPPDPRACAAAQARGTDLSALRARRIRREDFDAFDLILAMDREHFAHLEALRPNAARAEVRLFLEFHPERGALEDVPDPYYGNQDGFVRVLELIERTNAGLLAYLKQRLAS